MKIGKVPESVLKRSVIRQLHTKRKEVVLGAGVGEDCAALTLAPDEMFVMSTDPITGTIHEIGKLAILITTNDLASAGAEPIGVMLTILLPEHTEESLLKQLMQELEEAAAAVSVQIMGGHTEITRVVNQPLVTVCGVGKVKKNGLISTGGAKPGMDIIATKWIGLEGTAIIANEKEEELCTHFSRMAEASGVGLEIDLKKIPLRQETVEVCEFFHINPYELISSGCMLMAAADGNELIRRLKENGIEATVIGKATAGNDRVLMNEDERRFLEPPKTDELYKVIQ